MTRTALFKRYLIAGLLIWVPLMITIWVVLTLVGIMDQTLLLLPPEWRTESWLGFHIPGLGAVLTLVVVLATGALAANVIGQRMVRFWEGLLGRIPVVNSLYTGVKQISDTLFKPGGQAFRKALLVEWPSPGTWTIAFLTGQPGGDVANHLRGDYVSIYVPTTPNPTGGYFVMVPRSKVVELDMSVDEALKYIISMGVAAPIDPDRVSAVIRPAVVDQKAANE
ncbi:MAG TPA: DUF502 domain-containing protein [Burkholderiales bacterium]|nr:DUF502 domain-containing protein [Burkholderiales bacterium]